jgi:hypothetical protein
MAILAFANAGILIGLLIFLRRRNPFAYAITMGFLTVIAFLTITDEFGWADLGVLLITLIPLILLIKDRSWYLGGNSNPVKLG